MYLPNLGLNPFTNTCLFCYNVRPLEINTFTKDGRRVVFVLWKIHGCLQYDFRVLHSLSTYCSFVQYLLELIYGTMYVYVNLL
jgi:hypothetical protein